MSRRLALRLVSTKWVTHRITARGPALTLDELLKAGRSGERGLPEAGSNQVYVAMATLRKLGFRDALVSRDDGYLLDPSLGIHYGDWGGL